MLFKLSYLTRISKTINQIIFVNQFKNELDLEFSFEEITTFTVQQQYLHCKFYSTTDLQWNGSQLGTKALNKKSGFSDPSDVKSLEIPIL